MSKLWYRLAIPRRSETSGCLSVLESGAHIPFVVKRVFWLTDIPGPDVRRGAHAHVELRQVLFAVSGRCLIDLETVSGEHETVELAEDGDALFLDGTVWRTMHSFSASCALVVLCDRNYASDQVVRSREEFLKS